MTDDITYCASDCKHVNCKRNKANIKDHSVLHSWCRPEDLLDCPLENGGQFADQPTLREAT